ncbi:uncharacterized protein LOC142571693 isoform X2 [Dermacentor variabilis]|uniref:uncharacterized protein LOC142571693 isoform X2 n=1 Tax=Dermacentor variabilis TaxID=34621 RepID=UPI003F5BDC32
MAPLHYWTTASFRTNMFAGISFKIRETHPSIQFRPFEDSKKRTLNKNVQDCEVLAALTTCGRIPPSQEGVSV